MLICLISFLKVRLLTVTAGHPVQHSLAAGGSPSLLLAAKEAPKSSMAYKVEHDNSMTQQGSLSYQSSPRIRENKHWKGAEGGISTTSPDKCRIGYSPNQVWHFILNAVLTIDPRHSEIGMRQVEMYQMDRRPCSLCPICIFQTPRDN